MPSYRCPACGANHKEFQPQCRLCGQSLSSTEAAVAATQVVAAGPGGKSIKGVVLLGIGAVVIVVAIALVFGLVAGNKSLDRARDKVLPGTLQDGWSALTDPDGGFSVNLPGDRTKATATVTYPVVGGKTTEWTAKVGKDTTLTVGYGTVERPATLTQTSALTPAMVQQYLRQLLNITCAKTVSAPTTASTVAGAPAVEPACVDYQFADSKTPITTISDTALAGMPAITLSYTKSNPSGTDTYVRLTIGLRGDKVFYVMTESIYKDAEQFDRMTESFVIG